jgi:peptide/nickel transport system permease protein
MKFRHANAMLGCTLMGFVALLALMGSFYTPHNPVAGNLLARYAAPSARYWLGTDGFGRDVLSRLMAGASVSMAVSLCSMLLAMFLGTVVGVAAGYGGGWLDRVIMIFMESLMAFPGLLLALGIMTVLGPSEWGVVLALGLAYAPSVTRIARATVMSLRQRDFVVAARAGGHGLLWIIVRHILPNCVAPLLIFSTSIFGSALLSESALSFLGLGVQPPLSTWGGMLAESRDAMDKAVWLAVFPGAMIALTLLGINLLGDALRDRLDPRMRGEA